jgi:hypothetical protein
VITSVSETKDLGYIISGYSSVYGIGANDIVLIKTDESANIIWAKTFGCSTNNGAEDIAANAVENSAIDGGYFLAGQLWNQSNNTYEVYVLKVDSSGNKVWSRTMYNGGYDKGMCVVDASGGGCYVSGWVGNSSKGYLAKLDANGNVTWQKTVSKNSGAWVLQTVRQTKDGGFVSCGYNNEQANYEMWIVKGSSSGSISWQRGFAMIGTYNFSYDVCQSNDKGFLLCGGSSGLNLAKTDSIGAINWAFTYTNIGSTPRAYSVKQSADHGYIILSNDIGNDEYLMKIDSIGNAIWTAKFSGGYYINTVEQTSDGGYVLAMGDELIKTDANGYTGCDDVFVDAVATPLTLVTRTTSATATTQTTSVTASDGSTIAAIPVSVPCIGTSIQNAGTNLKGLEVITNPAT